MPHLCELKTAKIEFTLSISPSFVLHKREKENDYFVLNRVSIFDTFFHLDVFQDWKKLRINCTVRVCWKAVLHLSVSPLIGQS